MRTFLGSLAAEIDDWPTRFVLSTPQILKHFIEVEAKRRGIVLTALSNFINDGVAPRRFRLHRITLWTS